MGVFSRAETSALLPKVNILPLDREFQPELKVFLTPKVDKGACVIDFSTGAEKIFCHGRVSSNTIEIRILIKGLPIHHS